jgi:hypothetical protein
LLAFIGFLATLPLSIMLALQKITNDRPPLLSLLLEDIGHI